MGFVLGSTAHRAPVDDANSGAYTCAHRTRRVGHDIAAHVKFRGDRGRAQILAKKVKRRHVNGRGAVKALRDPSFAESMPQVGSAANAYKFGPEKRVEYLTLLANGSNALRAAEQLDINYQTVLNARDDDPEFAEALNKAKEARADYLEEHLDRMATENGVPGHFVPVLAILKARRPQVWRESPTVQANLQLNFTGSFAEAMAATA